MVYRLLRDLSPLPHLSALVLFCGLSTLMMSEWALFVLTYDLTLFSLLIKINGNIEPAKATGSNNITLVSTSVRPCVRHGIDLGNRSKDFSETWHEVGRQ